MGRYKTDNIYYENKEWPPEEIIAWGLTCVRRHPEVTIEIAAHLLNAAIIYKDEDLTNAGRELMYAAGSPCYFIPNDSAEQAMSNNNRPSVSAHPANPENLLSFSDESDEGWDSSRDEIFNKKIKPQAVKKAIDGVESEKIKDRPYYYVAFRILKILKYIPLDTSPRDFLLWVNLHFNCGWPEDPEKKYQLYFRLEGILKKLSKKHPSEWKDAADDGEEFWGNMNVEYYNLAISFKNVFTITMDKDKPVVDSESYEHLRDRVEFLTGARDMYGSLWAPEEAYINNGK